MEQLAYQDHQYTLHRFPLKTDDRLRAWDAADEYLLKYIDEAELKLATGEVLLLNDSFGALGVGLHPWQPVSWGDSHLARLALTHNLHENHLTELTPTFVQSDEAPEGLFSVVLIKLPKSLAFFEDQLLRLRAVLAPGAQVITGGMIKHTPKRAYQLLAEIIGETVTTQGWKKSRLAHSRFEVRDNLAPCLPPTTYTLPGSELALQNLPNVFSREKPDVGTRLLLKNLPNGKERFDAVDLGCGNGILAVALAQACPQVQILGVDESYQAVASARANAEALEPGGDRLSFKAADGLNDEAEGSRDLVVCNPPFHQGQVTGDLPAWAMFAQARRVLRPGGELLVVGNRHLGYHAKLKRLFATVELMAWDDKFVVLSATKSNNRV